MNHSFSTTSFTHHAPNTLSFSILSQTSIPLLLLTFYKQAQTSWRVTSLTLVPRHPPSPPTQTTTCFHDVLPKPINASPLNSMFTSWPHSQAGQRTPMHRRTPQTPFLTGKLPKPITIRPQPSSSSPCNLFTSTNKERLSLHPSSPLRRPHHSRASP